MNIWLSSSKVKPAVKTRQLSNTFLPRKFTLFWSVAKYSSTARITVIVKWMHLSASGTAAIRCLISKPKWV